jgi:hypothetical protein
MSSHYHVTIFTWITVKPFKFLVLFSSSCYITSLQSDLPHTSLYIRKLFFSLFCFQSVVRLYHGASFVQYCITDLCTKINYNNFLSTDNLKIFCQIKYIENCKVLESDTELQNCVANNHMQVNKRKIILFICRTNGISFNYYYSNVLIMHAKCTEDLSVMLDSILHVDRVYWKTTKLTACTLRHWNSYILFITLHKITLL